MGLIGSKVGDLNSGYRILIEVICAIMLSGVGNYVWLSQTMIPRAEAQKMVEDSEARSKDMIDKLSAKEDLLLQKLEQIEVQQASILAKLSK